MLINKIKTTILLFLISLLISCGGGSSNDNPTNDTKANIIPVSDQAYDLDKMNSVNKAYSGPTINAPSGGQ